MAVSTGPRIVAGLVLGLGLVVGVVLASRTPPLVLTSPNASIALGDGEALTFALVTVRPGGFRLHLSPTALQCSEDLSANAVALDFAAAGGPVNVDYHQSCDFDEDGRPVTKMFGSKLLVRGTTLDRVTGELQILQVGSRTTKRFCQVYRLEGGGAFSAPICRSRWQRFVAWLRR